MKSFVTIDSPSSEFSAIILATGIDLPHAYLDDISHELHEKNVTGNILFDLITCNGSRTNRFFSMPFDGVSFPTLRLNKITPSEEFKISSLNYMNNHLSQFDLSLLSPALKFAIEKKILV